MDKKILAGVVLVLFLGSLYGLNHFNVLDVPFLGVTAISGCVEYEWQECETICPTLGSNTATRTKSPIEVKYTPTDLLLGEERTITFTIKNVGSAIFTNGDFCIDQGSPQCFISFNQLNPQNTVSGTTTIKKVYMPQGGIYEVTGRLNAKKSIVLGYENFEAPDFMTFVVKECDEVCSTDTGRYPEMPSNAENVQCLSYETPEDPVDPVVDPVVEPDCTHDGDCAGTEECLSGECVTITPCVDEVYLECDDGDIMSSDVCTCEGGIWKECSAECEVVIQKGYYIKDDKCQYTLSESKIVYETLSACKSSLDDGNGGTGELTWFEENKIMIIGITLLLSLVSVFLFSEYKKGNITLPW